MPQELPDINLLPKYEGQASSKNMLLVIFIALILISYIVIGIFYFITKSKLEAVNEEHTHIDEQVSELSVELQQLETGGSSLEQAYSFVEYYEIPTSHFIEELDFLLPSNSYLSSYEYNNGETNISVHFETLDKVAEYTSELTTLDYILDARVDDVETFALEAEDNIGVFNVIDRYQSHFSLLVHKQKLKGAVLEDV